MWMGNPFSMAVVSYDRKRNTSGDVIRYSRVTITPRLKAKNKLTVGQAESRDPKHFANDTRNIILPNGKTESFHPRLMIEFNGKEIVY